MRKWYTARDRSAVLPPPKNDLHTPLIGPYACSRVIRQSRIRQNVMTHKVRCLSSGVHVSEHRISPYVTGVAKCVLPERKLYMSIIRSDVVYNEPFPDAEDRMSGNGLHITRHLKCGSVPGLQLINARCDDARVSVAKSYQPLYCLKQRKCDHAITERTGTGCWLLPVLSLSRQLMDQNPGSGYSPFISHSLNTG